MSSAAARLEKQNADLQAEVLSLRQENTKLKDQLHKSEKSAAESAARAEASAKDVSALENKKAAAEEEAKSLRQDLQQLRVWEEHREARLQAEMARVAELTAETQRLLKEVADREQHARHLEAAVVPQCKADQARLETELTQAREHQAWLLKEMDALRAGIASERQERAAYVCDLETKAAVASLERDGAVTQLMAATAQLQRAEEEATRLRRKVAELQDVILASQLQYTQDIGTRDRVAAAYTQESEQLRAQVSALTEELAVANGQLEELRGRREGLATAKEAEQKALNQRCLNAEREAVRLRGLLQRLGGATVAEVLPPARAPQDGASSVFVLSPTAGAVQSLRSRGVSSVAEAYASGLQAIDDADVLRAENRQLQEELQDIIAELEKRAPQIVANQRELQSMQQAFGALATRLEEVEGERSDLTFKLKEAEKFEKRVAQLTAENKDLSTQLRVVLFEKAAEPDDQDRADIAVAMGLQFDRKPKPKAGTPAPARSGKITFRSVDELVTRNRQLAEELRQNDSNRKKAIEDAVGSALRDVWAKVQGAQEEVTRLNQDYAAQLKAAETLQSQRDRLFGILKARQLLTPDDIARLSQSETDGTSAPSGPAGGPVSLATGAVPSSRIGEPTRRQMDALKAQVSELEGRVATERAAREAAAAEANRSAQRLVGAQDDEQRLRKRLEDVEKEATRLRTSNAALVAEQRQGVSSLKEAMAEASQAKSKLSIAEATGNRLKAESASLAEQLKEERRRNAESITQRAAHDRVAAALEALQAHEKNNEILVQRLTAQADARGEESQERQREAAAERALRRELEAQHESALAAREAAKTAAEAEAVDLRRKAVDAEARIQILTDRLETLAAQLQASEDRSQTLLDKLSTPLAQEAEEEFFRSDEAELTKAHETIAALQEQIKDGETRAKQLTDAVADVQKELSGAKAEIAAWTAKTEEAQKRLADKDVELEALGRTREAESAEVKALKGKIEELEEELEEARGEQAKAVDALTAELQRVRQAAESDREATQRAQAAEQAAREELGKAQQRVKDLEAELAAAAARAREAAEAEAKLRDLEAAKAAAESSAGDQASTLKKYSEQINGLEATVRSLGAELAAAREALEHQRREADAARAELQRRIEAAATSEDPSKIQKLEERVAALSRSLEECQEDLSARKFQVADLQDELEQSKARAAELADALTHERRGQRDEQDMSPPPEGNNEEREAEMREEEEGELEGSGTGKRSLEERVSDELVGSKENDEEDPPAKRSRVADEEEGAEGEGQPATDSPEQEREESPPPVEEESGFSVLRSLGVVEEGDEGEERSPAAAASPPEESSPASIGISPTSPAEDPTPRPPRRKWAQAVTSDPASSSASPGSWHPVADSSSDPFRSAPAATPGEELSVEEKLKQQLLQRKTKLTPQPKSPTEERAVSSAEGSATRRLCVTVLKGDGLKAGDPWGKSDPYCHVTVGRKRQTTKTVLKTVDPYWNEQFVFPLEEGPPPKVHFALWDSDLKGSDDPLGECVFDCAELQPNVVKKVVFPVLVTEPFSQTQKEYGQLTVAFVLSQ